MTPRQLTVSLGRKDDFGTITKVWHGTFKGLVDQLLKDVPVTATKDARGWICGAQFNKLHRHGKNFVARHLLSLDYDHIKPEDVERILGCCKGIAHLAYTTWSHAHDSPRIRIWLPLTRRVTSEEFQALSRRFAGRAGIDLAARESHTTCQFMFRPCAKEGVPFEHWEDTESPYLDVDKILGEYSDWKDRTQWPRRANEEIPPDTEGVSPLEKPGIVGDFCRTFSITEAIERFGLPYKPGSQEDRWTYILGSRPDGAVIYDDDTKLHSHHDTDPAHGQHNAYDLVRLHRFAQLDGFDGDIPLAERASSAAMAALANSCPEISGFTDLDAASGGGSGGGTIEPHGVNSGGALASLDSLLPGRIPPAASKNCDQENARRIQARYGKKLITVAGAFYTWTGEHWWRDQNEKVISSCLTHLSGLVAQEAKQLESKYGDAADEEQLREIEQRIKWAVACGGGTVQDRCKKMLRSALDFPAEKLNSNHALLTCRNGTINLRTGELGPNEPTNFITACAPVEYDPAAQCPRFELFLNQIFDGDETLVAFAKRWFGYCITGEVIEHAMVFHIGTGRNGKTALMDTLQRVLGSGYFDTGADGLLTGPAHGGATPEVLKLLGKRMVTLSETKKDQEFNEALLKRLTGSDRLVARNLYEGLTEFDPTHKLQVFTNHAPRITVNDDAIWLRLYFLKYPIVYGTPEQVARGEAMKVRDTRLKEHLASEAPGILRWLVEGAVDWYREGLVAPKAVSHATQAYHDEQDVVGQFLRAQTVRDPQGHAPLSGSSDALYVRYRGWIIENGHRGVLTKSNFRKEVIRAAPWVKYGQYRTQHVDVRPWGFSGIRVKTEAEAEACE